MSYFHLSKHSLNTPFKTHPVKNTANQKTGKPYCIFCGIPWVVFNGSLSVLLIELASGLD